MRAADPGDQIIIRYAHMPKPLISIAIEDMDDSEFLDWYNYLAPSTLGTKENWRKVYERYRSIAAAGVQEGEEE